MKYNVEVGLEFLENNEFEEAYNYFSEMVSNDNKNAEARYYRAFIDFFHFRKNFIQDYNDFKMLVDKNTKFKELSLPLLVILAEELRIKSDALKYARLSLKYDNPYMNEMKNILVKELVYTKEYKNIVEALEIIDSIIENDEEATIDNYMQKIEVQINFNDFDGAQATLEKAFTKFSANENLYFTKGRLSFKLYSVKNDVTYLEEAAASFRIALQYEPTFNNARLHLAECYALLDKLDLSLSTIDEFKDHLQNELSEEEKVHLEADIVVEKVKICELLKEWDKALEICSEFLSKYEHWKVYYTMGYVQNVTSNTYEDLNIAVQNLLKSYQLHKDTMFLPDLVSTFTILKQFDKSDNLIKNAILEEPDNGLLYYLLAENDARLRYDYDSMINNYKKAFDLGYMDLTSYVTHVSFLVEKPLELAKKHHKELVNESLDSVWDIRRMGIRYLFGEFGFKQNLNIAYKYLHDAYTKEPTEPCILTIYGRCLELLGKCDEAFAIYQKAYDFYKESIHITCNCACGYLAYAYLKGIGTSVDLNKAKELILEGINKDGTLSSSIVIYLYSYLSLLGEDGFSLNKALECLSSNFPFDRYDIVRFMYINKILQKLGQDVRFKDVDLKNCLNNQVKDYKKYYKENKDKDIIFPYYKNF